MLFPTVLTVVMADLRIGTGAHSIISTYQNVFTEHNLFCHQI